MFDPQNKFWLAVARVGDVLGLSICWFFCSLPLFTLGAATAALYDTAVHCVRGRAQGPYGRFFRAFRDNFRPACLITLLFLGTELLLSASLLVSYTMAAGGSRLAAVLTAADRVFLCVPLAIWLMAMPLLSRFSFGARDLLLTAARLSARHLPTAAGLTVLVLLCALVIRLLVLPMVFLPAAAALAASLPLEKLFARYQNGG